MLANASPIASRGTGWPGRRERRKCGRDDAVSRGAGAVAPEFVPRRIGPQFRRGRLNRRRNDRRFYRREPVDEGSYSALPLRLRRPKREEDRVVKVEQNRARQFHAMTLNGGSTDGQNSRS